MLSRIRRQHSAWTAGARERSSAFALPPVAKVKHGVAAGASVSELPLVNDQAGVYRMLLNRLQDLVEGRHYGLYVRLEQLQRQVGCGHLPGHRDPLALQLLGRQGMGSHHQRAVAVADARSTSHQYVLI